MTKGEQVRLTAWRLKVLQQAADAQNVAWVCRRFGISRKSFYKWKRRHAEHGVFGRAAFLPSPNGNVFLDGLFDVLFAFKTNPDRRKSAAVARYSW
jgi:hypothetical protein